MKFENIYRDLGVNSLDALAALVSMGAALNQPVANDVDAGDEIPVVEDLSNWLDEPTATESVANDKRVADLDDELEQLLADVDTPNRVAA